MSYLERYRNGEVVQVWEELIALGDQVREEPLYSDARAVARETMERARRNIETIYKRLQSIGYQFEAERSYKKGPDQAADLLNGLRDQLAGDSMLESMFGRMLGSLESMSEQLGQMFPAADQPVESPKGFTPPDSDIVEQLDDFEREIGKLPLSVRAWCEIVGSVDFVGDHPGLASYYGDPPFELRVMGQPTDSEINPEQYRDYLESMNTPFTADEIISAYKLAQKESSVEPVSEKKEPTWFVSDPLVFCFYLDMVETNEMIEEKAQFAEDFEETTGEPSKGFRLVVAPDALHKANYSGDTYEIHLPDAKADTRLIGTDYYFVAYLRESFAWGGFPGLKDHKDCDEKLIAMLKEGLEPI
jgi:hypothetical protein